MCFVARKLACKNKQDAKCERRLLLTAKQNLRCIYISQKLKHTYCVIQIDLYSGSGTFKALPNASYYASITAPILNEIFHWREPVFK